MLLTNHVLSGALTGALVRRPLAAFTIGVASHFVLDAVPHWGEWGGRRRFLRVAVSDGLVSLSVMGAFTAMAPPDRRMAMLAAMTGAALPDIDKPARLWFGRSPWPPAVDWFHGVIQDEAPDRAPFEFLAACVLAAAALTALQRPSATRLAAPVGQVGQDRQPAHSGHVGAGHANPARTRPARHLTIEAVVSL